MPPLPENLVGQKSKLLFIDDDPSVISSLELLLGKRYQTHSATTLAEGLRMFQEVWPQIVVLDIRLPDGSGLEALREIRKLDLNALVVILTGHSTRATAEESLRLGATDYINKPFNANELTKTVDRLIITGVSGRNDDRDLRFVEDSVNVVCDLQEFRNASAAFLHDVSNPLSSLMAGVDLLQQRLERNEQPGLEDSDIITMMSTSVGYLRALVDQWRDFSKIHTLMHGKCVAQDAINLAINQLKKQIHSSGVLLIVTKPKEKLYIPGNEYATGRILVNLIKNAIEAIKPEEGRIQLTIVEAMNRIELTVSDNGPGISHELVDQIFQPRVSTKAAGRGMGLFISKKIVEAIGGTISVCSPGAMGGTDFKLSLPAVD